MSKSAQYYEIEHVRLARKLMSHYKILEAKRLRKIENEGNYYIKRKKFSQKKNKYKAIVIISIRKKSLKYNDRGQLKISLWPKRDLEGNKVYDENGIVVKVERYDIIALTRLFIAANSLGEDVFYNFLSIYDVKKIMDNVIADYFGDLKAFFERKEL